MTSLGEEADEQELLCKSQQKLTEEYLSKIMYAKFKGNGKWAGSDGNGVPVHQFLGCRCKAGQRDVEQTKSVLRVEKPLRRARGQVSFPHH